MNLDLDNAPYALVVDDDLLIRMDAMAILTEAGFRVFEADHGDAAFDFLQLWQSEIVLLFTDVQMPGELDGFALARRVAELWPHISIVVASGHATPGLGSMPEKARFIDKPFSAELVQAHVREILPDGQRPKPLR